MRSGSNIHIPTACTNIYQNSFIPRTSTDWNSLLVNVTSNPSLPQFERYLDKNKSKVPPYYSHRGPPLSNSPRSTTVSLQLSECWSLLETDKCTCGEPETAQHYFFQCANFRAVRAATNSIITLSDKYWNHTKVILKLYMINTITRIYFFKCTILLRIATHFKFGILTSLSNHIYYVDKLS